MMSMTAVAMTAMRGARGMSGSRADIRHAHNPPSAMCRRGESCSSEIFPHGSVYRLSQRSGVSEMLRALAAACLLSLSLSSPALGAEDVDLELVFLADSSGSIDSAETAFQRRGHGDALQHP